MPASPNDVSACWLTSTPIHFFSAFPLAASVTELKTAPPQAKITSVPLSYHAFAFDVASAVALNSPA